MLSKIKSLAKKTAVVAGVIPENSMSCQSRLSARVLRSDGTIEDRGVVSTKSVTTEFVEHLVDNLIAEEATLGDYKYHVSGTNSVAEAITDIASTFATPDGNPLDTGTQAENGTNVYQTVATIAYTGSKEVVEHGVVNNSTLLSGKLLDRSVFASINVGNGDSIEFTYELTVTAGG